MNIKRPGKRFPIHKVDSTGRWSICGLLTIFDVEYTSEEVTCKLCLRNVTSK